MIPELATTVEEVVTFLEIAGKVRVVKETIDVIDVETMVILQEIVRHPKKNVIIVVNLVISKRIAQNLNSKEITNKVATIVVKVVTLQETAQVLLLAMVMQMSRVTAVEPKATWQRIVLKTKRAATNVVNLATRHVIVKMLVSVRMYVTNAISPAISQESVKTKSNEFLNMLV